MVTTSATSASLKTALLARSFDTHTTIEDMRSWYYGADVFTYIGQLSGRIKAVSDSTTPRLFEQSETNITHAWAEPELMLWLTQNVLYEDHSFDTSGSDRVCTLTVNGDPFEGIIDATGLSAEQADLEALAAAIITLLDDEFFDSYRA